MNRIPIRRCGNRPNLFMGGDREMVMFTGLLAFALIFAAMEIKACIYGVTLWTMGLYLFRKMAKADPLMRHVYLKSRKYKSYYPPRSTPFRVNMRKY